MRRRCLMAAMTAAVTMAMAILPMTAQASTQVEVVNNIGIGDISISLDEYEIDEDGEEIPYRDNKLVLPGQQVDKIIRITNQANTAWIRAKIEYSSDDGIKGLSNSMVTLSSDKWLQSGDFYYYMAPVEKDEAVDFIDQIRIPTEWDETYSDKRFSVEITADAVQTANFTPDFSSEDPWFGTLIETCIHTEFAVEQMPDGQMFSVVYEGGADGLVRTGDDFFANWGSLMPGDTVTDEVHLKNAYGRPVSIWFRTETIADDALLKALELEIKNGDKVIYKGTLDGGIKDAVLLTTLGRNDERTLSYTLHVPAELSNKYALSTTKTKWIFSAKVQSSGGGSGNVNGGNSGSDSGHGPGVSEKPGEDSRKPSGGDKGGTNPIENVVDKTTDMFDKIEKLVKTGDNNLELYAGIIALLSGAGFVIVLGKRRRKKDETEHL